MDYEARLTAIEQMRLELKNEYTKLKEEERELYRANEFDMERWHVITRRMDDIRNKLEFDLPDEVRRIQEEQLDNMINEFCNRIRDL